MAAGQLWLFPPSKPLVERLDDDFFRTLPSGPGVYFMCSDCEGVLYVGKARNLRKRLASYRVANPERLPRRIIRLLYRVTRIECPELGTGDGGKLGQL
jgi:excinuclease UvrABC nuclease subunit